MTNLYLAGGCFWCISDYILNQDKGVIDVICGYCGGNEKHPTYELVKSQTTKHRETIQIIFDENKTSITKLLTLYSQYVDIHDKDGQYIDKGYSYTLALYYQNQEERDLFIKFVDSLPQPSYIAIEPFTFFVKAEEKHQHFSSKNPKEFIKELETSNRTCHLALKDKDK